MNSSRRLRGGVFELRFRVNEEPTPRLGLVIPKKLARHAVVRNLIKRQVRESFRLRLPLLPNVDVVVRLAKPVIIGAGEERLRQRKAWRTDIETLLAGLTT